MLNRIVLIVFALLVIVSAIFALRDTRDVTTTSDEAYQLYLQGIDLVGKLYIPDGVAKFREALKIDSNFAMAHIRIYTEIMTYRFAYGTPEEAKAHLEKAFKQYDRLKKHERLFLDISRSLVEGKTDQAESIAREYVRLFPKRLDGHQLLANLYWEKGEVRQAIAEFENALAVDSTHAPIYNSLGYLEFSNGNFDRALKYFQKYIELLPDQANPYDSKGEILMAVGRYDEALEAFRIAHQIEPSFDFVLYHMAEAYNSKGMTTKADQTLDKIAQLHDDYNFQIAMLLARGRYFLIRGNVAAAAEIGGQTLDFIAKHMQDKLVLKDHDLQAQDQYLFHCYDLLTQANTFDNQPLARTYLDSARQYRNKIAQVTAPDRLLDIDFSFEYAVSAVALGGGAYAEGLGIEKFLTDKRIWRPDAKISLYRMLARIYFGLGRREEAFALIQSGLEINPNHAPLLIAAAGLYEKDGNVTKGLEMCRRALAVLKDADEGYTKLKELREIQSRLTSLAARTQ